MTTERQPPDSQDRDPDHDHFSVRDVVASYNTGAPKLAPEYEGNYI